MAGTCDRTREPGRPGDVVSTSVCVVRNGPAKRCLEVSRQANSVAWWEVGFSVVARD